MELNERQFNLYLRIARKYAIALPDEKDRVKALKWIQKISTTTEPRARKTKHHALQLLIICLQRKRLVGPFESGPQEDKALLEHGWAFQPADIAKLILQQEFEKIGRPPISIEVSGNLCEFVAYQDIPSFGAHFFYAFSPEQLRKWSNLDKSIIPRGLLNVTVLSSPDTSILARSVERSAQEKREKINKSFEESSKKHDQFVDVSMIRPTGQMKEDFVLEAPRARDVDTGLFGTAIDAGIIRRKEIDVGSPFKADGEKVRTPLEETVKVQKSGKETTKKTKKNVSQADEPVESMEHWVETQEEYLARQKRERAESVEGKQYYGRDSKSPDRPGPSPTSPRLTEAVHTGYKSPRISERTDYRTLLPEIVTPEMGSSPLQYMYEEVEPSWERSQRNIMQNRGRSPADICVLTPRRKVLLQRLEELKNVQPKRLIFDDTDNIEPEPEEVAFEKYVESELANKSKEQSALGEGEYQIEALEELPLAPEEPGLDILNRTQALLEAELEANEIFADDQVVDPRVTFKEVNFQEDLVVASDDRSCPKAGSVKVTKRIMEIPGEEPIAQTIFEDVGEPLFDETLKATHEYYTPPLKTSVLDIMLRKKLQQLEYGQTAPRMYGPWAKELTKDAKNLEKGEPLFSDYTVALSDDSLYGSVVDMYKIEYPYGRRKEDKDEIPGPYVADDLVYEDLISEEPYPHTPIMPTKLKHEFHKETPADMGRRMRKSPDTVHNLEVRKKLLFDSASLLELSEGDEEFLISVFGRLSDKSLGLVKSSEKISDAEWLKDVFGRTLSEKSVIDICKSDPEEHLKVSGSILHDSLFDRLDQLQEKKAVLEQSKIVHDDEIFLRSVFGEGATSAVSRSGTPARLALAKSIQVAMVFNKLQNRLRTLRGLPTLEEEAQDSKRCELDNQKGLYFGDLSTQHTQKGPVSSTPMRTDPVALLEKSMDKSFKEARDGSAARSVGLVDKAEVSSVCAKGTSTKSPDHQLVAITSQKVMAYGSETETSFSALLEGAEMSPSSATQLTPIKIALAKSIKLSKDFVGLRNRLRTLRGLPPEEEDISGSQPCAAITKTDSTPRRKTPDFRFNVFSPKGEKIASNYDISNQSSNMDAPQRTGLPVPFIESSGEQNICPDVTLLTSHEEQMQKSCPKKYVFGLEYTPENLMSRRYPEQRDKFTEKWKEYKQLRAIRGLPLPSPLEKSEGTDAGWEDISDACDDEPYKKAVSFAPSPPKRTPPPRAPVTPRLPVKRRLFSPSGVAGEPSADVEPKKQDYSMEWVSATEFTPEEQNIFFGRFPEQRPQFTQKLNEYKQIRAIRGLPISSFLESSEESVETEGLEEIEGLEETEGSGSWESVSGECDYQPAKKSVAFAPSPPKRKPPLRTPVTPRPPIRRRLFGLIPTPEEIPPEDSYQRKTQPSPSEFHFKCTPGGEKIASHSDISNQPFSVYVAPTEDIQVPIVVARSDDRAYPGGTTPRMQRTPMRQSPPLQRTPTRQSPPEFRFNVFSPQGEKIASDCDISNQPFSVYVPQGKDMPVPLVVARSSHGASPSYAGQMYEPEVERTSFKTRGPMSPGLASEMEIVKESSPGKEILIKRAETARGANAKSRISALPCLRPTKLPSRTQYKAPKYTSFLPARSRVQVALTASGNIKRQSIAQSMTSVEVGRDKTLAKKASIQTEKDASTGTTSMVKENIFTVKEPGNVNKKEYKFGWKTGPNVGRR